MSVSRKFETRADYPHLLGITTRWIDNDAYGHVNNVVYYSWFDTVVNRFLIDSGTLVIGESPVYGLVVATSCAYFSSVAFPDEIQAGLRVAHLGTSSVRYEIGLFRNDDVHPAAAGEFTHVYVDRQTQRPTPLPDPVRTVLNTLRKPD